MDGNNDISGQIRLMRSVIGRKIMEIDLFNDKAEETVGDDALTYANLIEFLNHDVSGYKAIIDDLRGRKCDYSGNLYDLASIPEEAAGLYNDYYVPALEEEDKADESAAMKLKSEYAIEFARRYSVQMGRAALVNQMALDILMADEKLAAMIGNIVLGNPELQNAIESDEGMEAAAPAPAAETAAEQKPAEEMPFINAQPQMEAALTSTGNVAQGPEAVRESAAVLDDTADAPTEMNEESF